MLRSWAADDQFIAIVTTRTTDARLNHVFMNATYNMFLSDDKALPGSERGDPSGTSGLSMLNWALSLDAPKHFKWGDSWSSLIALQSAE
ncbi:MAG: hypothetical protein EHM89_06405 [Acidobacteria bacterium]|nr:MAG: hypothetical protein EHM89_06405 [Acidobacteriota bacterium]